MYSNTHPHGDPIAGWEDARADGHVNSAPKHYHKVGFEKGRGGFRLCFVGAMKTIGFRAKTFDSLPAVILNPNRGPP